MINRIELEIPDHLEVRENKVSGMKYDGIEQYQDVRVCYRPRKRKVIVFVPDEMGAYIENPHGLYPNPPMVSFDPREDDGKTQRYYSEIREESC